MDSSNPQLFHPDIPSSTSEQTNDQKRRSSSRSIKRKRFDDEIVEYSLGLPPTQLNRVGRARTQSQSFIPPFTDAIIPQTPNPQITTPVQPTPSTSASTIATSLMQQINSNSSVNEKKRLVKGNKRSKKSRSSQPMSTKDLGRWKPIDDLALIIGIQQTNDLRTVHRGTKFSCKFTLTEMQQRWYALLYEEPISRLAVAAMRNLHPEIVENVKSKALYTVQEEEMLGTIKSTDNPTIDTFRDILEKHPNLFYSARTPKSLSNHWHLMKQYSLLPDQTVQALPKGDHILSFSDVEDHLNDGELTDQTDDILELELALADRKCKKEIRHLENELTRWTVLVDSLPGIGFTPEFDNQTLAVLRGRLVRYLMRSREITFGRTTKDRIVDVDLALEGPAHKVSRKQGTIKMRSNGDFFISNDGKRPIYIDGMPLLMGHKMRLNNNCVIEIAALRFIFLVNHDLIAAIRQESAKMNVPLN